MYFLRINLSTFYRRFSWNSTIKILSVLMTEIFNAKIVVNPDMVTKSVKETPSRIGVARLKSSSHSDSGASSKKNYPTRKSKDEKS